MNKILSCLIALSLLLSVALMANPNEVLADSKSGPAVDEETLIVATADEPPSLTTANHAAVAGTYMNMLTHNGLFRLSEDLKPVLDLAESYEVEEDENGKETIWVFKLKEGVLFHNGEEMTAEDFKASIDYAKEQPESAATTTSIHEVEVRDKYVLEISTGEEPSAILPFELANHANFVVPKALIDADHDFNVEPVGTGPFKLKEWKKSEEIIFEAHEDYFEGAPSFKTLVWKIIPEGVNRTIALQAGEIDYVVDFDSASVDLIEGDDSITLINQASITHTWLGINDTIAPFDDVNLRKALNVAINKEDVIEVSMNGFASPAPAQVPSGLVVEGFTSEGFDLEYDLDKAKEYLEAWGGNPEDVNLDIICSNDAKRRAAEVIQANLSELGINVTITSMDLATYLSETAALNHTGFIGGYTTSSMAVWLKGVFHSDNLGGSNKTGFNNPEFDDLVDEIARTIDPEESAKLIEEAIVLLNEECPQVPLYQDNKIAAHKSGLKNVVIFNNNQFRIQDWSWGDAE